MKLNKVASKWAIIRNNKDSLQADVMIEGISYSKRKAIEKFVNGIDPPHQISWIEYVKLGYTCKRINIIFELDDNYYKKLKNGNKAE